LSAYYEPLSHLDASFLALESRNTHMHVGAIAVFEAGPLRGEGGGIDIEKVRRHVASKLPMIPRYRERLAWVPLEGTPVWVDDEHFNLDFHVRHISLPRPGSTDQLKDLAGMLMSQALDREKPLWELYVVEGIDDDKFALVSKIHHAMIDGVAGVDLMAVLLGFAPSDEIEDAPQWEPRPVPNGTELFVRETSRRISSAIASLANVTAFPGEVENIGREVFHRLRAVGASLSSGWLIPASKTPINGPIGPNRRFDWLDLPLDDVKAIKNALGGTVNDVILATVAGGVRTFFLEERQMSQDELWKLDYRAMAPVSVRSDDQRGTMGNQVAMWLVTLPVGIEDAAERLRFVTKQTVHLKESEQALGASTIVRTASGAPATLVSMGARLAANVRPFNLTVTNVPGPQFPMYLLESPLQATYPLVPLWQGHGVAVALFSYDGTVNWGFNGDFDLLHDLPAFSASMAAGFAELLKAAENPPDEKDEEAGEDEKAAADTTEERSRTPRKMPPIGTR